MPVVNLTKFTLFNYIIKTLPYLITSNVKSIKVPVKRQILAEWIREGENNPTICSL